MTENNEQPTILQQWLAIAHRHLEERKEVPVVLEVELYEYFGRPSKITEANVYPGGCEVTVESRAGDTVTIESDELQLRSIR